MGRGRRKSSKTRFAVAALAPPPGLTGSRIEIAGREVAVLTFPVNAPSFPATLSSAEREVALAVIEGRSNAEIAAARKTSVHTVANQIVATFRKLGVHSRPELIVALAGPRRPSQGSRDPT